MACGFEQGHDLVPEFGFVDGEDGEGFERHRLHRDALFREAGANKRKKAKTLRASHRVLRRGNDQVTAGLPFFHGQLGGDCGEHIAIGGEGARFAAADEAGEFRGAATVEGIVGAKFAEQCADGCPPLPGEEVSSSSSGLF